MLVNSLLFQVLNDLYLGRNGGVVGSRLPQCIITLHSLITDQNILHGVVERMSHMKLSGNIWRRHHDGKRFLTAVHFRMEIAVVLPFFVKSSLDPLRIICLGKFFAAILAHCPLSFSFLIT